MSQRYSSKSHKKRSPKKLQVNQTSIGAALLAKDPKLAESLAALAKGSAVPTDRTQGGPKIMPGSFTPAKKSKQITKPSLPKKKQKQPAKGLVNQKQKKPVNKPLKVSKVIVKKEGEFGVGVAPVAKSQSITPDHKILLKAFEDMVRTDGIENAHEIISYDTQSFLQGLDQNFNNYIGSTKPEGQHFYITIGFDFGTSSSKIVVNAPFGDGRSFAFPVPREFQMDDHPNLWKSILFQNNSKASFELIPDTGSIEIANLKTSLMSAPNRVLAKASEIQLTAEHLCAVKIGLMLRYVKGWIWANFKAFFGISPQETKIIWEANFGLPAATLNRTSELQRFELVFNTAWMISEQGDSIWVDDIHSAFEFVSANQGSSSNIVSLRPEVAAEAIGLLRSNLADFGTYALIDIGASTLDICVFDYLDGDEIERQALFVADVSLLGAQSPNWLEELNSKREKKFSENVLYFCIREAIGTPVVHTKNNMNINSSAWRDTLRVILAGGGKYSKIHKTALQNFRDNWLKHTNTRIIEFIDPKMPKGLIANCNSDEFHRLSVAWGLSINRDDFVKIDLPNSIEAQTKRTIDYAGNFISKDDV